MSITAVMLPGGSNAEATYSSSASVSVAWPKCGSGTDEDDYYEHAVLTLDGSSAYVVTGTSGGAATSSDARVLGSTSVRLVRESPSDTHVHVLGTSADADQTVSVSPFIPQD